MREFERFLVVDLGLRKSTKPVERSAHATMSQGLVRRLEISATLVLKHGQGVLILHDRGVVVSLALEDAPEVDMDLVLLSQRSCASRLVLSIAIFLRKVERARRGSSLRRLGRSRVGRGRPPRDFDTTARQERGERHPATRRT